MVGQIVLLTMYLPACIVIILAVRQSKRIKVKKTMTQDYFTVMLPDVFIISATLLNILTVILTGGFMLSDPNSIDWISGIISGLLFWFGTYGIVLGKTFKVVVKNNEITVHKAFRKPYTFTFSDITSAVRQVKKDKIKSERIVIKTSFEKKLIVENLEISYEVFMKKIQEKVNKKYLSGFED